MDSDLKSIRQISLALTELYEDYQFDDDALRIINEMGNLLVDLKKYRRIRLRWIEFVRKEYFSNLSKL